MTRHQTPTPAIPEKPAAPPIRIGPLCEALERATEPGEIIEIGAQLDAFETYMHDCGLYSVEDMRPVNEVRMLARWKLGQALAKVERTHVAGPGRGRSEAKTALSSLTLFLENLGLTKPTALDAQRIGTLPKLELERAFTEWRERGELLHYADLILIARPYWYKAARESRHRSIRAKAAEAMRLDHPGPFVVVLADPPWEFEIYSEKGAARTAAQHYPTLSDDAIANYLVDGHPIDEIAHKDAALLLWCTSSNILRAAAVMEAWGFTFKTNMVWVKAKPPVDGVPLRRSGLGLVARNMHEHLLYGTRGKMPGPQYQPPSVFFYPRGEHSAKPAEIRGEIERMYPDFDARTRLELFARGEAEGWTSYGLEM